MLLLVRPAAICWHKALEMSSAYGFETRNYDNFCRQRRLRGIIRTMNSIGIVSPYGHCTRKNMCNLASDAGGWTHDPFDPILSEDGKYLFGRGTCDNKSCGIMAAVRQRYLKEHNTNSKTT